MTVKNIDDVLNMVVWWNLYLYLGKWNCCSIVRCFVLLHCKICMLLM